MHWIWQQVPNELGVKNRMMLNTLSIISQTYPQEFLRAHQCFKYLVGLC
jgi:hypothetical protein